MERSRKPNRERRYSLIVLTVTLLLILVIVIAGILIGIFTADTELKKILLLVLLVLLILLGLGTFLFFEYQRKETLKKRNRSDELWLQRTLEEQRRTTRPTPPMTESTSWALTMPWRHRGQTDEGHVNNNSSPASTILPPYSLGTSGNTT